MFEIPEEEKEDMPSQHNTEVEMDESTRHLQNKEGPFVDEATGTDKDVGGPSPLTRTGSFGETGAEETGRRPRRRRKKTVSCPAHMLFNEADRHVASNYFFG
mmetsp:Transcript_2985/g.6424  ORF Transcript_2985/g.6424 Transcript_2985/m.6424 type:complete len:102 (-) Transcript_2985:297-602(-)